MVAESTRVKILLQLVFDEDRIPKTGQNQGKTQQQFYK